MTQFTHFLDTCRSLVDGELERLLPDTATEPVSVHQAIRWSVFAGGKRFRPALVLAAGETFGAPLNQLLATACALELIHTYSLIHDDLPSMDNDDLRRGMPTCHVKFGEATAILAGDALQALAFKIIANDEQLSPEVSIKLISLIGEAAATPRGMVAGQALDLEAEAQPVTALQLEGIHRLKTGALIVAAAQCGAMIGNASEADLKHLSDYAAQLGLLFQITDDLLDVTASAEALGKTPGKDARSQKATYPGLLGLEVARQRASQVHRDANAALKNVSRATDRLQQIVDYILQREA